MEQLYQSRYTGPEIDRRLGLVAGNFLWIKWSSAFPVVEMLDEPGPYIGIYTGESNDPPDDPAEYKWYLNSGPQGPKGDTGTGLDILGTYATLTDLQTAVSTPTQGDMYNIGSEAPYHVYMWDTTEPPSAWKDQGILQGPPGQDGAPGQDGMDGQDGADGVDGAPGPNEITTGTDTTISGIIKGASGKAAQAVAGTDYATPEQVDEKLSIPAQFTALPTSGTALTNNAEYRVATAVGTYVFAWPDSPFECWLRFTTDATFSIAFPAGTTYIGGAPTFKASTQYEMSVKDGVVIVQEVVAS